MSKPWLVTIGNGLTGVCTPEMLFKPGVDLFDATVFSAKLPRNCSIVTPSPVRDIGRLGFNAVNGLGMSDNGRLATVCCPDRTGSPDGTVVMAAGVRPDMSLAEQGGLVCNSDMGVDDTVKTADPGILPVGECVRDKEPAYGLLAPLFEQVRVAAVHFVGRGGGTLAGLGATDRVKEVRARHASGGRVHRRLRDGSDQSRRSHERYLPRRPASRRYCHVRQWGRPGISMRDKCQQLAGPP